MVNRKLEFWEFVDLVSECKDSDPVEVYNRCQTDMERASLVAGFVLGRRLGRGRHGRVI